MRKFGKFVSPAIMVRRIKRRFGKFVRADMVKRGGRTRKD